MRERKREEAMEPRKPYMGIGIGSKNIAVHKSTRP